MTRTTVLILSLALLLPTISLSGQGDEGGPGTLDAHMEALAEVRCAGLNCIFDASGSQAPADATYTWGFGDGNSDAGVSASHSYADSGYYVVDLTIEDSEGATDTHLIAHRAHPFGFDLDDEAGFDNDWNISSSQTHLLVGETQNLWRLLDPTECGESAPVGTNVLAFTDDDCDYNDELTDLEHYRGTGNVTTPPIDMTQVASGLDDPELWFATMWELAPCAEVPSCLPNFNVGPVSYPGDREPELHVELSTDGNTWTTEFSNTDFDDPLNQSWQLVRIPLSSYAGAEELQIRFVFDNNYDRSETGHFGWFIDRIRIDDASAVEPVAHAAAEIVSREPGENRTVLLDGSLSVTQGEQASFTWDVDDGEQTPTGATATVQLPPRDETYPIELTVTDETEETGTADINFEVPIVPLKADVSATQPVFHDWDRSNETLVVLDGSLSDGEEAILSWNWSWEEDGEEQHLLAEDPVTEHVFPVGAHEIFLNVTGESGDWNKTAEPIVVFVNQIPIANASESQTLANDWDRSGSADLELDGSLSSDADGTIESWKWTWVNETGIEKSADGEAVTAELPAGDTPVTLNVTDEHGGWNLTTFEVRVNPIPTADTTGTQTLVHNWERGDTVTVQLDGTESTDDRQVTEWNWTWDAGDDEQSTLGEEVEIDLPNGTTTVSLNVTDDDGAWDLTTVDIVVNPVPIANPSNTDNVVPDLDRSGNATVVLDGSESEDLDDGIVSWNWTWTNETGDHVLNLTEPVSAPIEFPLGNTTVTLNVTDDQGAWDETNFTVRVNDPPHAAITNTSHDFADDGRWVFHNPLDELEVTIKLDGTESHDLDGDLATWEWFDLEDDNEPLGMGAIIEPPLSVGDHTVLLQVTDDDGHKNRTQVPIRVLENQAPSAEFEVECAGLSCTFTDMSTDPDEGGQVDTWSWVLDGEEIGTEANLSHRFDFEDIGQKSITLNVSDNGGAWDIHTVMFTLEPLWSENFTDAEIGTDWIRGGGPGNLWKILEDEDCVSEPESPVLAFNRGDPDCDYDTGSRVQGHVRSVEITELSDADSAEIQLVNLRDIESFPNPVDIMRVQVSTNNQHWATIHEWDSRDGPSNGWETDTFDISGVAGHTVWIRFQFDSVDEVNNDLLGWLIDQITIA